MLDIVPSTEKRPCTMMPVELAPYLLSASPPSSGFSLHSLSLTSSYTSYSFFSSAPSNLTCPSSGRVRMFGTCAHSTTLKSSSVSTKADETSDNHSESDKSTEAPPAQKKSSPKKMKHVSFADHVGKPLAEVRLVVENPTFIDLDEISKNSQADDFPPQPLEFKGSQPYASSSFFADLKRKMVTVENVCADNYKVTCTLWVNKRPSAKRVFARFTLDSWQNYQDITGFSSGERSEYETYIIEFEVPRTADRSKFVEFAVCYEADGVQHWDNNEGKNYILEWNEVQEPEEPSHDDSNGNPVNLPMAWFCKEENSSQPFY